MLLKRIGSLPVNSVSCLVCDSLTLGKSCWMSCLSALSNADGTIVQEIIISFGAYVSAVYDNEASQWIQKNWTYITQE